ncbi:mechanosensitive ion channel family protein [Thermosulfurimonas dismutans]|nr:mechanosensitive ion channel domain-containing protein [Thermosulfurimonas dismutans]
METLSLFKKGLYFSLIEIGGVKITLFALLKFGLILILGIIALRFFRRRLQRFLSGKLTLPPGALNSTVTLFYYFFLVLLVLVALSTIGINLTQIGFLLGAFGVGIGFGLQTIANNFISGLILLGERSLKVDDLVELEDGTLGIVKEINIRSTIIRTFDGQDLIVPNSEFISKRISTWTYGDDWRRIHIPFGVAYGSDPEKVKKVVTEAARKVPLTEEDSEHPIRVWFIGFGDSSLEFALVVWIRQSQTQRALTGIKSDYYYAIHRALVEAGIEIPFPQRDIHFKSISPELTESLRNLWREQHG